MISWLDTKALWDFVTLRIEYHKFDYTYHTLSVNGYKKSLG